MDIFLSVPEELSKQFVVEWLHIVAVAKLDSAYISHNSRARFLSLIANPRSIIKHGIAFDSADKNIAYVTWLARRSCHIQSVCIPMEILNYPKVLHDFFPVCGPSLIQIELRGYYDKSDQVYDSIVPRVSEHCHYLQELTLSGGFSENPALLHQLCLRCPYINKLTFNECMRYKGDCNNDLSFFALRTFAATDTPLSDNFLVAIATGSANLQELSLTGVSSVSLTGLETVAANCPLLQTVRLIGMYVEDADVLPFVTRCKNLHTLEVVEPEDTFTDVSLTAIAKNCPLLNTLRLAECAGISDSGVEEVLESCTDLRHLSLTDDILTDDTLYSVAEHCPLLRTLSIESNDYFSEAGLAAVAGACTALQRVTFSTDGALTQESADLFSKQVEVVCEEYEDEFSAYSGSDDIYDLLDIDVEYYSNSGSD